MSAQTLSMGEHMDDLAFLLSVSDAARPTPAPSAPWPTDPLGDRAPSTYVKSVRGGMPDAPIVVHEKTAVRDTGCDTGKRCLHRPRCIPLYVTKCRAGQPCDCPPASTHYHADGSAGMRSRGTVQHVKRAERGEIAGDKPRTFWAVGAPDARQYRPRYTLQERRAALLLLGMGVASLGVWAPLIARMAMH